MDSATIAARSRGHCEQREPPVIVSNNKQTPVRARCQIVRFCRGRSDEVRDSRAHPALDLRHSAPLCFLLIIEVRDFSAADVVQRRRFRSSTDRALTSHQRVAGSNPAGTTRSVEPRSSAGARQKALALLNRTIVSQPQVIQGLAPVVPTAGSVSFPLAPNTGVGGLPLTSTSSAPAAAAATSNSGAIAPPSGTASLGAMGRDMPECMAAWDNRTHIAKSRWKEICKRSLADHDL